MPLESTTKKKGQLFGAIFKVKLCGGGDFPFGKISTRQLALSKQGNRCYDLRNGAE